MKIVYKFVIHYHTDTTYKLINTETKRKHTSILLDNTKIESQKAEAKSEAGEKVGRARGMGGDVVLGVRTKDGKISSIVPMVSHLDQSEHSVKVLITEHGVADLRGKSPIQRAHCIIDNCVAPEYRDMLRRYLESAPKAHTPANLNTCFEMHRAFAETGDMRNAKL